MNVLDYLSSHFLLLDGGFGTLLPPLGLKPGELPESWNLTHPKEVYSIHKAYYDAGSNLVSTNTFGANLLKFSEEELVEVITAAVSLAKQAKEDSRRTQEKFIALDIGPLGKLLKPFGDLEFEEAVKLFSKTISIGASLGVDLIFIETMNDSFETKAALLAAKESCQLPIFVSNAYGEDGKLMTGADPLAMIALLEGMGADAIGMNCSLGPKALLPVVEQYLNYSSLPVILKPNAGLPRLEDGETIFSLTAKEFADQLLPCLEQGVRIVGGCCGTTPEFISALHQALEGKTPRPLEEKKLSVVSSYTHGVLFGNRPILIGERINPTGKKRLKQALLAGETDYILTQGILQQEAGADLLDVNVGLPEIEESTLLPKMVFELQGVSDLPLQIDSADPKAIEQALRCYNGKAMINSVNGKEESMNAIFPLAKKYGGMIVALTLDESGIPETAEGRLAIAEKIATRAKEFGISKENLIFDPLAMTISANGDSATVALTCLRELRRRGYLSSLGVSNISFGLPQREVINQAFLVLAMEAGLSAAILNPTSREMMKGYHAYLALSGQDENCASYLAFAQTTEENPSILPEPIQDTLQSAILSGRKEQAGLLTAKLLETLPPLEIIQSQVIPALDQVGKGYEEKKVYLPQLLMSAEAAKAAFEEIKTAFPKAKADKCKIILATVAGDIHDIGKNIVKLLLENYGFAVTDLGKDVPPQAVLDTVLKESAPLAGLSALMTTTLPAMEETISLLKQHAPFCKVMVGGAILTCEYSKTIGADFYAKDGMEAVRIAEQVHQTF